MSLVLSTANYTQFEKDFFITEAVIGLDTVNKGLMYVATGVKNDQYAFPVLSAAPKLQTYGSTPTASGTTTLSNRLLTLGKFQAYEEFEPSVFENHWHKDELADRLLARSLPTTFQNYLTTYYTQKTFKPIEEMIHVGSTTYLTTGSGSAISGGVNEQRIYFDGIIKTALNATTPALQVASPSAITSANVIAKMEAAKNKLGSTTSGIALLSRANRYDRLKYVMSVVDALKYEDALTTTTYKNNDTTEKGLNKYKGYEVVVVAGLPENTFYFGEFAGDLNSNLQLAVTDMDNLLIKGNNLLALHTLKEKYRNKKI
jgi:hypothetical protein